MNLERAVPILTVSNVEAATEEYPRLLGLDKLMDHGWIATLGSSGGAEFSVMTRDKTAPINPTMSLRVETQLPRPS
jgi:hypothetical protein